MTKSSLICDSCGEDNQPNSDYCIKCGANLVNQGVQSEKTYEEKNLEEYRNWKKSVPYTLSACIFLIFIDLTTGSGLNWSYWAVLPIFLFAILAPFLSYKMS